VHAHGVEQTFVVKQRPAAIGDLAVELAVQSALQPVLAADGGVHFHGTDGAWHVHYGAATAIDAHGDRRAMRTELDGARIRLVCDAAWLEHAAWPVTVDPLVQPNPSVATAPEITGVDVYRDDAQTTRNLWLAITLENANGDRDLLVRRCDEDLGDGVDVFTDVTGSWSTDGAQLAGTGGSSKVGAVFTRDFGSSRAVRWHLHDKSSIVSSTLVGVVPGPVGTHDWQPDVGGTRSLVTGDALLLVWQRETAPTFQTTTSTRVLAAVLDTASGTQGVLGTAFRLDIRDDVDQESPAVTPEAEGGTSFSWLTAWRGRQQSVQPFLIVTRRVANNGLTGIRLDAPVGLVFATQGPPKVAGSNGRYLLAFGRNGGVATGFNELVTVRIDWPHALVGGVIPHDAVSIESGPGTNVVVDSLAFDSTTRSHWVLTRRDVVANVVRATKLGFRGRVVEHDDMFVPSNEQSRATAVAFDDDANRFVVLAGTQHMTSSLQGRLHLGAMVYDPVAAPAESGTACGIGRVRWVGSQHVGDQFTSAEVFQAEPQRPTLLALALAPANVPLDPLGAPGCTLLVDALGPAALGVVVGITDAAGRFVLPLPLTEGLPAMDLHLQAFQLAPSPSSLGLTATKTLRTQLGR
jgi:hypothetical protein